MHEKDGQNAFVSLWIADAHRKIVDELRDVWKRTHCAMANMLRYTGIFFEAALEE